MHRKYELSVTTQGPLYPPSEVMTPEGDFVVIGAINDVSPDGRILTRWGRAIVSAKSEVPDFGERAPYTILRRFDEDLPEALASMVLHTLPIPLPCNNYQMLFAPSQYPEAREEKKPSYAFHETPIPDAEWEHGRSLRQAVTLGDWMKARGTLEISLENESRDARFSFSFSGLVPNSLYTIMTLRERDLDPSGASRPAPLGIPNAFKSDQDGFASFEAVLPDPFPDRGRRGNRVINVVVLFMSYQMSHGGAIGRYGLGGDIHAQLKMTAPHAQLKMTAPSFSEFTTRPHPNPLQRHVEQV